MWCVVFSSLIDQICVLQMLTFHPFNAQPLLNFRKQPEEHLWEHTLPSAN
jgi:hypothetical protein